MRHCQVSHSALQCRPAAALQAIQVSHPARLRGSPLGVRILFLHSRKFEYGQDLMLSGLWARVGPGHVFGHPRPWHDFLPTRP